MGPRVRYNNSFGTASSYRLTQTIRWQTNNYWQINSRVDFNHAFGDRFFFRADSDTRFHKRELEDTGDFRC